MCLQWHLEPIVQHFLIEEHALACDRNSRCLRGWCGIWWRFRRRGRFCLRLTRWSNILFHLRDTFSRHWLIRTNWRWAFVLLSTVWQKALRKLSARCFTIACAIT